MDDHRDIEIISHTDAEVWTHQATDKFNILPRSVQAIHDLLYHDDEVGNPEEEAGPNPELVTSLLHQERFAKAELRILRHLQGHYYLARTFWINPVIMFVVLDERRISEVVFEFTWDVSYSLNNHVNSARWFGAHWISPQFDIEVSSDGRFVILLGPQEKVDNADISSAKILDCQAWTVQNFSVYDGKDNEPRWPVKVTFDPRQDHSHLVTMIICRQIDLVGQDGNDVSGLIIQYDLQNKHETQTLQHEMSSELLIYLKEGKHLMCMEDQDVLHNRRIFILDSDTLEGLIALDFNTIRFNTEWRTSSMHLLPLYSTCYRYLSLVFWTRVWHMSPSCISDVITVKLPYIGDIVPSLRDLARAVILSVVDSTKLRKLPLPPRLKRFLYGDEACP